MRFSHLGAKQKLMLGISFGIIHVPVMLKKIKQPNLEHLRSFHQICIMGSIGATVSKTGSSRATLSRHIASLEADLSSILFKRGALGFILTALGKTVFEYADNIFKEAENLSEAVLLQNSELTGPIKIIASSGIATIILPSIISELMFEIKGLQLELLPTGSVSMDSVQDADIAIQTHRPTRKDLIASKVGEINYGVYASVKYLEKKGMPETLQDLKKHCIIGTIPETLKQTLQALWGQEILDHDNIIGCEDYPLIWQLVVAGCGIGVTHRAQGDAEPSVKLILTDLDALKLPVWLAAQPDLKSRARLQLVYSSLAEKIKVKLKNFSN